MTIIFYQTNKLDGYLDEWFYQECMINKSLRQDSFYKWYADIFFVHRKKNLIISNQLTKFTFFIIEYQKQNYSYFGEAFAVQLSYALSQFNINPAPYISSFDDFKINTKPNKPILSHIAQLKAEILPDLKGKKFVPDEIQVKLNQFANDRPTTFSRRKVYYYPSKLMQDEFENRGLN